ncbi:oxygenase MpaB family protein [Streptomyces sp. NPDC005435]|uniref:oxygenase MpaB family protein n=1 Tax=Streptomyces sp. NPDC005435 TaxID=3154464 RepID=UPI00345338C3
MVSTTQHNLPARLVNLETARDKHGPKADLMADMLQVGDPLADAVIAEINELGKDARAQLNKGITEGLDSVPDATPAIKAFLAQVEQVPEWVDRAALEAGEETYRSVPPLWQLLSSAGGQLVHTYASPSIAKLLVQTGQLHKMAPRRLAETEMWVLQTVLPGGLLRGAPGYVSTAQVRLLHARVRATALKHGWDHAEWGVPINQVDIARTWLDFTIVPYLAKEKLGVRFTEQEQRALYRYWHYVAYLLGLDERFYGGINSHADAAALLDLLDSTITPPDDNSRALSEALLDSYVDLLTGLVPMERDALRDLVNGLVRRTFGDKFADALHIPPSGHAALIPVLAAAGAQSWQLQRSTPESAEAARRQFTALLTERVNAGIPDGTAYQQHAAGSRTA